VRQDQFLLENRALVRGSDRREIACTLQYDMFWEFLRDGFFARWYQSFFTTYAQLIFQTLVLALLYCIGPLITRETKPLGFVFDLGTFLTFVSSVQTVMNSIRELSKAVIQIFASSSYLDECSKLLNFHTEELRVFHNKRMSTPERHSAALSLFANGTLQIKDVSFSHAIPSCPLTVVGEGHPILNRFNLYDRRSGREIPWDSSEILSAGCIIGLCRKPSFTAPADTLLLKIFSREVIAQSGVCRLRGSKRFLISEAERLIVGTLWQNLTYGSEYGGEGFTATQSQINHVWGLCHLVGVNPRLLGTSPASGWQDIELQIPPHYLDCEQKEKVALVRALLIQPQTLLLDHVGEGWSPHELRRLQSVVRMFASGEIATHSDTETTQTGGGARTIIWVASQTFLSRMCTEQDFVLTLESSSRGVLQTAVQTFPENLAVPKLNQAMPRWCASSSPHSQPTSTPLLPPHLHQSGPAAVAASPWGPRQAPLGPCKSANGKETL